MTSAKHGRANYNKTRHKPPYQSWIRKSSRRKRILSPCKRVRDPVPPDFKLYHRAIVIKTTWYQCKSRQVDQWNGIEYTAVNPHSYGYMTFDEEDQKQKKNEK